MNRLFLLLSAAGTILAAEAFGETKTYDVGSFTGLDVSRVIDVVYTQGPELSVTAEIDDGDFDQLIVRNNDGVLELTRPRRGLGYNTRITEKNGKRIIKINGRKVEEITVYITAPDLRAFDVSSSSRVTGTGLDVGELYADVSSSSKLTLAGQCTKLTLDAGSSGKFAGEDLSCGTARIDVGSSSASTLGQVSGGLVIEASSSADVTVEVASGDISIEASSSADVILSGVCGTLSADVASSGDIDAQNLSCDRVDAEASSSGDIWVRAASYVDAEASSGADIEIFGQPGELRKSESSGGDVVVNAAL